MVRWTGLGAVVEEEDGWTDHGDGIEREGDNPTYHGFFAEPIEWLREQLSEFGACMRSSDFSTSGYERPEAFLYKNLRNDGPFGSHITKRIEIAR